MIEYIIYGILAFLGLTFFVVISIAKYKIGWSWIGFNEKEDN